MTASDSFADRPPQGYIPQTDAVEAAARALDPVAFDPDGVHGIFGHQERPSYRPVRQEAARATATRALAAAAPLIAQQTLLDAAESLRNMRTTDDGKPVAAFLSVADWLETCAATLTPKE